MVDVAVMGAGSFGTAMAKVFADATRPEPHRVRMWCRRQEVADQINAPSQPIIDQPKKRLITRMACLFVCQR